jgi:5,6-dimethylbenzimidazole synthase
MIIFDDGFRARLLELFTWRRDVRRFRVDPLPPQTLERLIHIACLSPSVGLSQPWQFVIVDVSARRRAIAEVFEACNAEALSSYPRGLGDRYAKLKLAGIKEASRLILA